MTSSEGNRCVKEWRSTDNKNNSLLHAIIEQINLDEMIQLKLSNNQIENNIISFIEAYIKIFHLENLDFLAKNFESDTFLHVLFKNNQNFLDSISIAKEKSLKKSIIAGKFHAEFIKITTKFLSTEDRLKLFRIKNVSGDTILNVLAASSCNYKIFSTILELGKAYNNKSTWSTLANEPNKEGLTPLSKLISNQVIPELPNLKSQTIVYNYFQKFSVMKEIYYLDLNYKHNNGHSYLSFAIRYGCDQYFIKHLIKLKTDHVFINETWFGLDDLDNKGNNILHQLLFREKAKNNMSDDQLEILKIILEALSELQDKTQNDKDLSNYKNIVNSSLSLLRMKNVYAKTAQETCNELFENVSTTISRHPVNLSSRKIYKFFKFSNQAMEILYIKNKNKHLSGHERLSILAKCYEHEKYDFDPPTLSFLYNYFINGDHRKILFTNLHLTLKDIAQERLEEYFYNEKKDGLRSDFKEFMGRLDSGQLGQLELNTPVPCKSAQQFINMPDIMNIGFSINLLHMACYGGDDGTVVQKRA